MNPFDTVHEFERQIAEYTGAPYATATDCCTHALYMCLYWHKKRMGIQHIVLPKNTYVSVAMQAIHLGLNVQFDQIAWSGAYDIGNTNVVDGAARLYKGCYQPGKQQCLSFQFKKILSTVRGGMILTDDREFYDWCQRAVHDGRDMRVPYEQDKITFADAYTKFEAGTMQTAEVVAFAEALTFIEDIGIKKIASHENEILQYGLEKLRKNNSVNIIGDPKERGSVLCFTLKGIHPHDIATILDDDGVAIRAGHHCCQILHDKLGISATARASIGVYNDKEDIDKLSDSIKNCQKVFQN